MKRTTVFSWLVALVATVAISSTALAQSGWMESWSHDDYEEPQYSYHIHAYVGAEYYIGGDELGHWRYWVHGQNDTEMIRDDTGTLWVYPDSWHNTEWGWTETKIYQAANLIDWEYVSLPDFHCCPY